jgi:quercetin dioxygenase-like cupin family protein
MLTRILPGILLLVASNAALCQSPGGCDTKAADGPEVPGCYLAANEQLGTLPADPLFWHLYTYRDVPDAKAHSGPRSTVVESFGQVWVYTIAPRDWRPAGGKRMAVVGPLPHQAGRAYTARYMEAVFMPGTHTSAHTHAGPEAWYVLAGTQCLETPNGTTVVTAGESSLVPEGAPMTLSSVGTETRRSVLLVLHDSSKPWMTAEMRWKPKGLCPQ